MDKFDILEAMSGIRDEYIKEAAVFPEQAVQKEAVQLQAEIAMNAAGTADEKQNDTIDTIGEGKVGNSRKKSSNGVSRRKKILVMQRWAASVAALLCISIIIPNLSPGAASVFRNLPVVGPYFRAVTFRAYEYSDDTADAYVEQPVIVTMSSEEVKVESAGETEGTYAQGAAGEEYTDGAAESAYAQADAGGEYVESEEDAANALAEDSGEYARDDAEETYSKRAADEENAVDTDVSAVAAMSAARITAQIREMAEEKVRVFEDSIREETGYHSLRFTHEVTTDSDDWFSLKMLAYTSAADGFEQVTHFSINKKTGGYVTLETLFGEDTDYITPLSEEVIRQMRERMAEDPDITFWLDSEEEPEYDFREISPYQDFYFNSDGALVLCFNEGEAAPMYMGTVEFVIPDEVTQSLLNY